jgi:serine kinase of HPr protein (carbohydrate metabolism regulator)
MIKPHQATCVAIKGRAILIEGPAGSGKSSLALALIDRGATLVGDDGVLLEAVDGRLLAAPHPNIAGRIEVRNLGLLDFPTCPRAPVALLVHLDSEAPRFPIEREHAQRLGITLPLVRLWPRSEVLALRAELALRHFGLP